jgi:hypothetical protein
MGGCMQSSGSQKLQNSKPPTNPVMTVHNISLGNNVSAKKAAFDGMSDL